MHVGNAVVHAALAGGEKSPYRSMVMGSVLLDAAGMSEVADSGTNSANLRAMKAQGPAQQQGQGGGKRGSGKGSKKAAKALKALASGLNSELFLGKGGKKKAARPPAQESEGKGSGQQQQGGGQGGTEQEESPDPILSMLPMVEQLFAEELELSKAMGTQGLLAQLEQAAGGEMPVAVALRLMQTLGEANKAGGGAGADMLEKALGKKGAELAQMFLPPSEGEEQGSGGGSSELAELFQGGGSGGGAESEAGSEQESEGGASDILALLPKVEKLLADEAKLGAALGGGGLLEQLEKAISGEMPGAAVRELVQVAAGSDQGSKILAQAMGDKGTELIETLGLGDQGEDTESADASEDYSGNASDSEASDDGSDIRAMLPMVEQLISRQAELAKALEAGGLKEKLEKATGGELAMTDAMKLLQQVGEAAKAGPEEGEKMLLEALGENAKGLVEQFLPKPDTGGAGGGGGGGGIQTVMSAPLQVARSVFKDRLTPAASDGSAGLQEIADVKGADFGASRPLRRVLNSGHGAFAENGFEKVVDAMASAMETAAWDGYDSGRIIGAGSGALTERIDAAPQNSRVATALEIARKGNRTSVPYQRRLQQDLRHLLDDGEGGFDYSKLNSIQVYISDVACRSLNAEAFTYGNMIVLRSDAPAYEIVKEEVIHVIQQGGVNIMALPSAASMTKPTDAVEVEAAGIAGGQRHADHVTTSSLTVARAVSIGESQGEVFNAVVENVIPNGYSENINVFTSEADQLQTGLDDVKQVINTSDAFPMDKVDALFSSDAFDIFDPNQFQTSLKASGDTIVEEVVGIVMGICDNALAILDGMIGVVTEIMNVVESFVQLLDSMANALDVLGAILIGIGTGLIFVVIPSGIGSQFVQWGGDLKNIGSKISNLSDQVKSFLEPLKEVIEKIEKVKEQIEVIREITGTIQECLDVYEWFNSDTAEARRNQSDDMMASVERTGELLGQLTGGKYQDFATKFWENSLPVIDYVLEGQPEVRDVNDQMNPGPLGIAVPGAGPSAPDQAMDPTGVNEAFAQKKGERGGEGKSVYKDIVDPISWPTWFKPKPSDGISVVLGFITKGTAGDAGMPDADTHTHPGQTQGGGPGSGESIVSGAIGVVGNMTNVPLNVESLVTSAVEVTSHILDQDGYPSDIAETFDYLNNIVQMGEPADSLEVQGSQRMQEARILQENAQNSITASQNIIDISIDQQEKASRNEDAGHEGVGFMQYLQNLSQELQSHLQTKMQEMMSAQALTENASDQAVKSAQDAAKGAMSGGDLGVSGGGIASMLATAIIQVIIQQLIPQLGLGEMLKNLIPEDLGKIIDLSTTFIDTAQGSFDRAVQKEQEANYSEGVLNQAIATDQAAQNQGAQQQAEAEQMRATAEETLAKAEQAEADGESLREQSAAFDQALKDEQAWIESNLATHLSDAGPMRPRTETEFVDAPTDWEGVGVDNPASKAAGDTVVNEGPLPVSSDMGYPDPVAGPVPTELIQAVPLPPVISDIFSTSLDAYRMYSDLDLQWSGAVKEPTMAAPAGTPLAGSQAAQTTREQPQPILVGGGGGGGYDEGWQAPAPPAASAEDLVSQREFVPDQLETHQGVEKRAEDPQIPFTPDAQRAQLSQPASDALAEQEALRHEQIQTAQGQIPTADFMYNTLAPLPSILPPQPEFVDLEPMDTSGLGYNTQKIMIDPDIAQVRSWISSLPTDVKLLGPGTTGGLTMPTIMKPDVPTATGLPVLQLPELVLNPVPGIQTPGLPATEVRRDHPEKFGAAQDVRGADGLLDLKHEATLARVGEFATEHESRESEILGQAQQRTSQVQTEHQSTMDQTLTRRDQLMKEIRDWMEQSQNDTIQQLEQRSQDQENARFDAMQNSLDTGLADADAVMREGENIAFSLQDQATTDALQVNAEAMAKVATMWGWFQEEVSTFTANIATMLSQLWNSANMAVDLTLTGAQMSAMNTLTIASDRATTELSELGLEVPRIYGQARSQLGDIGAQAQQRLREAIDETVLGMIEAATSAGSAVEEIVTTTTTSIDQLSAETEGKVEAEWEDFDAFAEKLRQADVIGPAETHVDEGQLRDPAEPIPSHPSESRDIADTARDQGGASRPGPDASGQTWNMPQERAPAPVPQGQSASEVTSQFVTSTPTAKAETWKDVGQSATQAVQIDETAFQSSIDPLVAQMGGETAFPGSGTSVNTPGGGYQQSGGGSLPQAEMAPTPQQSTAPVAQNPTISAWSEPSPETDARPNASQVAGQINQVPVTDPSIITNPGPAPIVPLTGAADPTRMGDAANEALTEATQRTTEAMQEVAASPGPELVVPLHVEEAFPVDGLLQSESQEATEAVAKMDEYLEHGLTGDVTGQFDSMYGPDMEANLADFQQQVLDSESERDLERETQITDAQRQARMESERAQSEQLSIVDEKRRDITEKREETVQAQQEALDQLSADARSEYDTNMAIARGRVDTTQRQINQEFISAQRRAEDEVRQGERRALEEKQRAERESENQSWWRRAANWVQNALRALTDTINSIFDAVRSAVTTIIDGVKALATTLIDAATAFIQQVIETYGRFLTFAIDNLIGRVFPELAQELTEFVDAAVDWAQNAIEHLATNLRTFVGNLLDTLTGVLDGVLKLFQTAVNVQLGLAYALLTGDWQEGLKMALDAVLALAGIDPGEFYSLLGTADDTIMHVLRNPGEFVSNAISAAGQGFGQFGSNFLTHVVNGFTEWAFGASISVGLLMEQEWSARSVFGAGADLLGLSEPKLMEKTIEVVGQENVARFSWVWEFVENAIQGGVIGLWDHVQENLGGMYEGVVDTIQNWLMVNIAQEAAIKLISMFSPVGAIVQAVMTAWDVYVFLRDNIQSIYAVISSFVDNFSQLAMGNLTAAANGIEQGLADLIPIAIDLLAQIFGLGGAQEKVFDTVDGIRDVIDTGVTVFLEGLSATFPQQRYTGMHDSEKNIPKHEFADEWDRPHEMWMEEDGTVWMKSTPEQWQNAISHEERDWNYLSEGDKGSVTQWANTAESGVDAGITGDTAAVDGAVQALAEAAGQLPGAELPATPIIEEIDSEAETKKNDGKDAVGQEANATGSDVTEGVEGSAPGHDTAQGQLNLGASAQGDIPDTLDHFDKVGQAIGWFDEMADLNFFHDEIGGQVLPMPNLEQPSRWSMLGEALGQGAWQGLKEGAFGIAMDTAINALSSKVPYLAGFVEVFLLFKEGPGDYFDGVLDQAGFGKDSKYVSGWSNLSKIVDGDIVSFLTGILDIGDAIKGTIATISKICWLVAGLGAIAALFFPVLWPFVALAAKWGAVLGTIATTIGVVLTAIRFAVIAAQSLSLLIGPADPETLIEKQEIIQAQTATFVQTYVERKGDKARDALSKKWTGETPDVDANKGKTEPKTDAEKPGPIKKTLDFVNPFPKWHTDGWSELKTLRKTTWEVATDKPLSTTTAERSAMLESRGIPVYANDAHRNFIDAQLRFYGGNDTHEWQAAHKQYKAAKADYEAASETYAQSMARTAKIGAELEQTRQRLNDAEPFSQESMDAARQQVEVANKFVSEYETKPAQDRARAADDVARKLEYESSLVPGDANKRLAAQDFRQMASDAQTEADAVRDNYQAAMELKTGAEAHLANIERAQATQEQAAGLASAQNASIQQEGYDRYAKFSKQLISEQLGGQAVQFDEQINLEASRQYGQRMDKYAATPFYKSLKGAADGGSLLGQNQGSGKTGSLTGFIMDELKDSQYGGVLAQHELDLANAERTYVNDIQQVADSLGTVELRPTAEELANFPDTPATLQNPGDGDWPNFSEQMKGSYLDTAGKLPEPPMEVPETVNASAEGMEALKVEQKAVDAMRARVEAETAKFEASRTELQTSETYAEASIQGIQSTENAADVLLTRQRDVGTEGANQVEKATTIGGSGQKAMGLIVGIASGFMDMLDAVPGRYQHKVASGRDRMTMLKDTGDKLPTAGEDSLASGKDAQAYAAQAQADTTMAKGEMASSRGEMATTKADISQTKVATDGVLEEFAVKESDVEKRQQEILTMRQQLAAKHAESVADGTTWVNDSRTIREGGIVALQGIVGDAKETLNWTGS